MKCPTPNEGTSDRIIRLMAAIALFAVGYFWLSGYWPILAYIAAAAALLTSITGYCHLYTLLGWNTAKHKK